ncbi:hypothetical protein C7S13_0659 [Burkholderia cepacia]|nr:hypothetical protein [Burkholderia cepacia]
MLDLGLSKMALIGVVALVVLGPSACRASRVRQAHCSAARSGTSMT